MLTGGVNGGFDMKDFVRPDKPNECKWSRQPATPSPHTSRPTLDVDVRNMIMPDILTAIGNTPLVRLNRIPQAEGVQCQIFAKCEFLNPGGSVKDRIGYRMVRHTIVCTVVVPNYYKSFHLNNNMNCITSHVMAVGNELRKLCSDSSPKLSLFIAASSGACFLNFRPIKLSPYCSKSLCDESERSFLSSFPATSDITRFGYLKTYSGPGLARSWTKIEK